MTNSARKRDASQFARQSGLRCTSVKAVANREVMVSSGVFGKRPSRPTAFDMVVNAGLLGLSDLL